MARVYNFAAGPAVLPEDVLQKAAGGKLGYRGCGLSGVGMSHPSQKF